MTEETLFELALKTPVSEREALLDRACVDKPGLKARVLALLKADAGSSPLLKQPHTIEVTTGFEHTQQFTRSEPIVGNIIAGRYALEQKLGEGGMGEVWVAKQSEPVKRRVALKLIKAGMDSKSVVQRFEQERQALALMDHPNIAKVLDGGIDSYPLTPSPSPSGREGRNTGRPFFIMELVNGLPLTKFCDEEKLGIRERLELFVPICQAVQHAHQKGIIHRDLKPGNILVTMIDGRPVPKVIDFGVAKATSAQLTEESLSTQFGTVVGTIEYMSPEQAGYSGADIDTRADIYSLGILLYELLTGLRPFDSKRLKKAALDEMIRMIREDEPSKPSTRLSTDEALPSLAAVRHIEPGKLTALLRGELDWVVMKCLEKQRERRYETANGLARDIQRYLADEPVEARPPSMGYRFQKFMHRHRPQVIAGAFVLLSLIAGIIGTTMALFWAMNERDAKEEARQQAVTNETKAREAAVAERQARGQAEQRLTQIEKGNEILTSIFSDLDIRQVKKGTEPLEAVLAERLVKAGSQLEGDTIGDPLVVARLQYQLGMSLMSLGKPEAAIPLFIKSHATRAAKLGADTPDTQVVMTNLAVAYRETGKLDQALPLLEESCRLLKAKLGIDDPETLSSMNNLASIYWAANKHDLALAQYEEILKLRKAKLGADHQQTLTSMNNLATSYWTAGKKEKAVPLMEETLELLRTKLGADHADTMGGMNNLAAVYFGTGKLDKAVPLFEEILKMRMVKLGADHPNTIQSMSNLASGYRDTGKIDQALPLFQQAAAGMEKRNFKHEFAPRIVNNLVDCHERLKQFDQAEAWQRRWLAVVKEQSGSNVIRYADALESLALTLSKANKMSDAESMLRESLALHEKLQPSVWTTSNTKSLLGGLLLKQKKYPEAEPLLLAGYEGMKREEKTIPAASRKYYAEALQRLIQFYTETNKPEEVKKWQAEKQTKK